MGIEKWEVKCLASSVPKIIIVLLLFAGGCATLPDRQELTGAEEQGLRNSFKAMVASQQQCRCCLDSSARVKVSTLLFSGGMAGYLQALSPSYLKFVAINPLGQPVGVLTSDGQKFRYVDVLASIVYDGNVDGQTFAKYAPAGFGPAFSYYWLIGRLQPGPVELLNLSRDNDNGDIWVELQYDNNHRSLLLFAPEQGVILRHVVLDDNDERLLNILYSDYGSGPCPMPGKITITSLTMGSTLEISLTDFRQQVSLHRADFVNSAPPSFKQQRVD